MHFSSPFSAPEFINPTKPSAIDEVLAQNARDVRQKEKMGRHFLNEGIFPPFEVLHHIDPPRDKRGSDLLNFGHTTEEEANYHLQEEPSTSPPSQPPSSCSRTFDHTITQHKQKEIEDFFHEADEALQVTEDEISDALRLTEAPEDAVKTIVKDLKKPGNKRKQLIIQALKEGFHEDYDPFFDAEARKIWAQRNAENLKAFLLSQKANQIRKKRKLSFELLQAGKLDELDDFLQRFRQEGLLAKRARVSFYVLCWFLGFPFQL